TICRRCGRAALKSSLQSHTHLHQCGSGRLCRVHGLESLAQVVEVELLAANNAGGIDKVVLALLGAAAQQHFMDQHVFGRKHRDRRAEQRQTPAALDHLAIEDERVNGAAAPNAEIVEQLDAAPQNALPVELHCLLLLLEELDDFGKFAGGDQNIDILDRPAIAVEVRRATGTDRPLNWICVEQALYDT